MPQSRQERPKGTNLTAGEHHLQICATAEPGAKRHATRKNLKGPCPVVVRDRASDGSILDTAEPHVSSLDLNLLEQAFHGAGARILRDLDSAGFNREQPNHGSEK